MRIAIVSTPFVAVPPPGYGGTELVVDALAHTLAGSGHDVTVFATGDSRVPGLRACFARPVWPPEPYAELLHCRFAAREISTGAFDVVHAHIPAMLAFAGTLGVPLVYTIHHARDAALGRLETECRADVRRVAISARQAALHVPAPDHVVHHGLDPGLYPDAGEGGAQAFFLGRLSWCKGPELAVEAAREAGLPLVVAGDRHPGPDEPPRWEEETLAPALRSPRVAWVRDAGLEAKRRAFAQSRALLVPLRWEEPFGLVMIEAALAGCPVIAFPRGAAPEIVEEGVTGFLVEDVRGMAAALREAGRLDRRAIQARARLRFSARRMTADYLRVYRSAIRAAAAEAEAEAGAGAAPGVVARAEAAAGAALAGGEDAWTTLAP